MTGFSTSLRCARHLTLAAIATAGLARDAFAQQNLPVYRLAVRVQPDSAYLMVSGTVRLPSADSLRHAVRLQLASVFGAPRFALASPAGDPVAVSSATSNGVTTWTLRPTRPLPPHQSVVVQFAYAADVGAARSFHVGADGSFVEIGWYPQDEMDLQHDSRSTGSIAVDVPAGFLVAGTGVKHSTPGQERRGHFAFVTTVPRRLAFTVAHYAVTYRTAAPVPISLYLLSKRSDATQMAAEVARDVEILTREFGPFPYPSLSVVEIPTAPARASGFGGRSVNGILLLTSDNIDRGFNRGLVAHELTHQWWADMLEPRGTQGEIFMLSEAMATYGSLQVVTTIEGPAAAETYRQAGYPGYGDSNLSYYLNFSASGLDTVPLTRLNDLVLAHDLAATKGFRIWDMLRREVGAERFRAALIAFAKRFAFKTFTWRAFTEAIDHAAGRDLGWFYRQWLTERAGLPEWHATWAQQNDSVRGSIAPVGNPYRATVALFIAGATPADTLTLSLALDGSSTRFAQRIPFRAQSVTVDPHFLVAHWPQDLSEQLHGSAPVLRVNWLDQLGHTREAFASLAAALDSIPYPDRWAVRYQLEYSAAWMYLRDNRWSDARQQMTGALALRDTPAAQSLPCRSPGGSCSVPWGYYLIANAARQLGDSTGVCQAVDNALAADSAGKWGAAAATQSVGSGCGPRPLQQEHTSHH